MATAIVSGRVDAAVKERASAYIHAAGLTTGEVIGNLISFIARTKSIPHFEGSPEETEMDAFERFMQLRHELHAHRKGSGVPEMTNGELREYLATERLKDYEALS